MLKNRGQSVQGESNIVAGRDVNIKLSTSPLLKEIRGRLQQIENRVNERFPSGFLSRPKNDSIEPFSFNRLLESLLWVGIPLDAAVSVAEMIETHLIRVLDGVEQPTTHHIRQAVTLSIYELDLAEFGQENIQKWGDRYARQYGSPDFRTKVLHRDGSVSYLDHRFLKEEFLPHLITEALGTDYVKLRSTLIRRSQLDEMAETIISYIRMMNFYQIRYKALFHLVYDIAVQPPHPWFVVEPYVDEIVDYDLGRARAHAQRMNESFDNGNLQSSFHSVAECIHHASSAILAVYGNFIGCGYLSPLVNLINSLKLFQFKETILWEFSDFKQIEGDLEAVGSSVYSFLRHLSLTKESLYSTRSELLQNLPEALLTLINRAKFLLDIAEKLVEGKRKYRNTEKADLFSSAEDLAKLAKDVFSRVPSCKFPPPNAISCPPDTQCFCIQYNINSSFFHTIKPIIYVVVYHHLDEQTMLSGLSSVLSVVENDTLSNVLVFVTRNEKMKEMLVKQVKALLSNDRRETLLCVVEIGDLLMLHNDKHRELALENMFLRSRIYG